MSEPRLQMQGESVKLFGGILDQLPCGVFVSRRNGSMTHWNELLPETTGYSSEELTRMSPPDLVVPTEREPLQKTCRRVCEQGKCEQLQTTLLTRAGEQVSCICFLFPVTDTHQERIGLAGGLRTESESSKSFFGPPDENGTASGSQRDIAGQENGLDERQEFLYAISHDLSEPLRQMRGCSGLLKKHMTEHFDNLPEEVEKYLQYITEAAESMQNMVDALLRLSRISQKELEVDRVKLRNCVERAKCLLQQRIQESDAEITTEDLPSVRADADLIVQVFQNLISNAIQYSGHEPPEMTITADEREGVWVIGVRDQGRGMRDRQQKHVFKPFASYSDQETQDHGNTGIGLAICRRIIREHDGGIWVESAYGEGSYFQFSLPKNR